MATKKKSQRGAEHMPPTFWRDWDLVRAGIRGEVEILPETKRQWSADVKRFYDAQGRLYGQ